MCRYQYLYVFVGRLCVWTQVGACPSVGVYVRILGRLGRDVSSDPDEGDPRRNVGGGSTRETL